MYLAKCLRVLSEWVEGESFLWVLQNGVKKQELNSLKTSCDKE
jgi:hypothetical protein